jgi:hypothetical protein
MTIYLYVKTHNKTGLKYLGQTTSKDPHNYRGSGTYWKLHIKKHGYEVTTKIVKECSSIEDIRYWGLYYSNLWNVVESREWANLKEETGDARGKLSKKSREKIGKAGLGRVPWNKGKSYSNPARREITHSKETRKILSEKLKGRVAWNKNIPISEETKEKLRRANIGKTLSEETKIKISKANKGKHNAKAICPHCNKEGQETAMKRWHFNNCKNK